MWSLLALLCAPTYAAELRLLRAHAAEVRTSTVTAPATGPQHNLRLELIAGGERHDLRLRPKTHLGPLANRVGNRAAAYEGFQQDRPGSWVAVTRIGNRWTGLWFDGVRYFGLDSASKLAAISTEAAAAAPDATQVFRLQDAVWQDVDLTGDTRLPIANAEDFAQLVGSELAAPSSGLATLPTKRLAVALLADADLARQDGSQTETNMLALLNVVDGIFANQVGVRLQSGSVSIFNDANQPFTATTDSGELLNELRDFRSGSTQQRASGLSHLLTGRNLNGATVGIAYLRSLCSSAFSASLSEARRELSFAALIAAHEIGHVFGAPHDTESGSACENTPAGMLMAPQLTGSQTFSDCSLEQIAPVVAAASCLAPTDAADARVDAPQDVVLALDQPTDVTITVNSVGNATVNGVNLRIILPLGMTLVAASGPTATCASTNNVVDCGLGSIIAGATSTVTLRLTTGTAGSSSALVRVSAQNDALRVNDSTTVRFQAAQGTDLEVVAQAEPLATNVGANTTATFTLHNRGPVSVTDARLSLTLPPGLGLVSQTPENTICAVVTGGLSCGPTALEADASLRVVLVLRADSAGSQMVVGEASSSRPEMSINNNTARLSIVASSPPPPTSGTSGGGGGGGPMTPPLLAALALWALLAARRRATA